MDIHPLQWIKSSFCLSSVLLLSLHFVPEFHGFHFYLFTFSRTISILLQTLNQNIRKLVWTAFQLLYAWQHLLSLTFLFLSLLLIIRNCRQKCEVDHFLAFVNKLFSFKWRGIHYKLRPLTGIFPMRQIIQGVDFFSIKSLRYCLAMNLALKSYKKFPEVFC